MDKSVERNQPTPGISRFNVSVLPHFIERVKRTSLMIISGEIPDRAPER